MEVGEKIHTSTEVNTKGCRKCLKSLGREMNSVQAEALCALNSRSRQESVFLSSGSTATVQYLPAQSLWEMSRSLRAHFGGF